MSSKLDQSLDTIMGDSKPIGGRRPRNAGRRRGAPAAKTTAAAPTGGVQKSTKAKKAAPAAPAVQAPKNGDSKIIVSNLPMDVNETLVKDFFSKAIGSVKKVTLAYGPNGKSRGEATIIFGKPDSAARAQKEYNNVGVDGRPMRIELVGGSAAAPEAAKAISERIAKPKSAAKENQKNTAAKKDDPKSAANGAANGKNTRGKKKSGRAGRPKPKTADELDAEMADYFGTEGTNGAVPANGVAPANGAAQPAPATDGEDVVM
ncbi:hypothetical protein KC361_g2742 [Hortaea werneckii]|nr:hypothetical protein KC361_g2742 [Hortaea werneckii]